METHQQATLPRHWYTDVIAMLGILLILGSVAHYVIGGFAVATGHVVAYSKYRELQVNGIVQLDEAKALSELHVDLSGDWAKFPDYLVKHIADGMQHWIGLVSGALFVIGVALTWIRLIELRDFRQSPNNRAVCSAPE